MKKENISLNTKHAKDKINSHKEIIIEAAGERKARYVFEQLEEVIDFQLKVEEASKVVLTLIANKKILKVEEDKLKVTAHQLFKEGYKLLSAKNQDAIPLYFKKIIPSTAKTKLSLLRKALKSGLVMIENPEYNELNNYKDEFIAEIEKINLFLTKNEEFLSIEESSTSEYNELIEDFKTSYHQLKIYAKAALLKSKYDYRELFLDLGKSATSSSKSSKLEKDDNSKKSEDTPKADTEEDKTE